MKKRNKYLLTGVTFLASTTILLACSNTTNLPQILLTLKRKLLQQKQKKSVSETI